MSPTAGRLLLAVVAAVLLSACGGSEDVDEYDLGTPGDDPTVDETDPEGADTLGTDPDVFDGEDLSDATLTTRDSPLGPHLVDGSGRTVYVFALDPPNERTCTDDCLSRWPVVSSDTDPDGAGAVEEDLLDTIEHDGDGHQVTYNEQPLYYYVEDQQVGDLEGQGRNGEWFVLDPQGVPIRDEG